jgi:hypothetical protein
MLPRIISWVCRKSCDDIKFTSLFGLMAATPALWSENWNGLLSSRSAPFYPNEAKKVE